MNIKDLSDKSIYTIVVCMAIILSLITTLAGFICYNWNLMEVLLNWISSFSSFAILAYLSNMIKLGRSMFMAKNSNIDIEKIVFPKSREFGILMILTIMLPLNNLLYCNIPTSSDLLVSYPIFFIMFCFVGFMLTASFDLVEIDHEIGLKISYEKEKY